MTSTEEFRDERMELQRLLNSSIFHRAPNLILLLNYVCARYFERQADQIKEYNIAVEALGRPADFDPRGDSIVRVEAHRLRKRLTEFYSREGSDHPVHIEIPPGQYAPRFLIRIPSQPPAVLPSPALPPEPDAAAAIPPARSRLRFFTARRTALAALLLLSAIFPIARLTRVYSRSLPPPEVPAVSRDETIRIACGLEEGEYTDRSGNLWMRDAFFQGGSAVRGNAHPIRGTSDQWLYNTRREGSFRYDIPLKQGIYELRLHFAETVYGQNNVAGGGESSRVFSISINSKEIIPYFDVIADHEASTADIKVLKDISPAGDGRLHLEFTPVSNIPILSGIEITPGLPGRMRPIRMVAQDRGCTDKQGRYWEPDRYVMGGQLVARASPVTGGPDQNLFHGERFGNLNYVIPVAEGRYRVRLYFAETWFGTGKPGGEPGSGRRAFDVLCNGVAVRRDFDVFKEAGGTDRAAMVEIPGVTPNHQGKIVISLLPVRNYAMISAIEIVDES